MQKEKNQAKKLSVFILGTTAVGKTKLSIELAKYLQCSIISTDSKQLYCHADLLTAKATKQQQSQAKHFMLDCIQLQESSYNRNKFYQETKKVCKQLWRQDDSVVFVGGTNYYIEPLLFKVQGFQSLLSITNEEQMKQVSQKQKGTQFSKQRQQEIEHHSGGVPEEQAQLKLSKMSLSQKYQQLRKIDYLIAQKLHKNDQIRITSFLKRYFITGEKPSCNYKSYSQQLNNKNTVVFWVRNTDKEEHQKIVTKRICKMMEKEGVIEIISVFTYLDNFNHRNKKTQNLKQQNLTSIQAKSNLCKQITSSGVGQSIGYGQFFQVYFQLKKSLLQGKIDEKDNFLFEIKQLLINKVINFQLIHQKFQKGFQILAKSDYYNQELIDKCTMDLIKNTMAYCKRQITWIKNRMFQFNQNLIKKFYILQLQSLQGENISVNERFQKQIKQRAISIIQSLVRNGEQVTFQLYQNHKEDFKITKTEKTLEDWKKYQCSTCKQQLNGAHQWQEHLQSKKHLRKVNYNNFSKTAKIQIKAQNKSQQLKKNKINKKQQEEFEEDLQFMFSE